MRTPLRTLTRLLFVSIALLLVSCSKRDVGTPPVNVLPAAPTQQEQAFAAQLEHSIKTKDVAKLMELTHWNAKLGRPDLSSFYQALADRGCHRVVLTRTDPSQSTEWTEGDTKARASLPVEWHVTVDHSATQVMCTDLHAGQHEGVIKLVTVYAAPNERNTH